MSEEKAVEVKTRLEGEVVPEGVSCTETSIAWYVRIRRENEFLRIRVEKRFMVVTDIEREKKDEA